jgi:hypothetical protein
MVVVPAYLLILLKQLKGNTLPFVLELNVFSFRGRIQ